MSEGRGKIGKSSYHRELTGVDDKKIIIEAAMRRGQSITELIKPTYPSPLKVGLSDWKNAWMSWKNVWIPQRNPMYLVYDNVMIDLDLSSVIETRVLKVQQSKFNIKKGDKADVDLTILFQKPWFNEFIKLAMQSKFEGYVLLEFFKFKPDGQIDTINEVDKYHVKPERGVVTVEAWDVEGGYDYLNGPISQYYIPVGTVKDLGMLYKCAPFVLAKKYAIGTWGEYNEKMGIPFRTVTTNTSDKVRSHQLAVIMENMGSAGWAVINEGEKVELMKDASHDPVSCFEKLIAKLDASIANYILGQSSTSNSTQNKGTYGSMKILQDITDDRHEADLTFIKYLINDILIPRMITWGYKLDGCMFDWDKSVELDVAETVDYVVALSGAGFEIPTDFITQKTGIPITGLKVPALPAPPEPPIKKPKTEASVKKKSITDKLTALYSSSCGCSSTPINHRSGGSTITAKDPNTFQFSPLAKDVAKKLYDGKQKGIVDYPLLKATAQQLREAITFGYRTNKDKEYDAQDIEMLHSLDKNVYVFSAFKNYQQLRTITDLLKDENGNVRTFNDFKERVLAINETQNVTWLNSEYNHAVVASQWASDWQGIQRDKDILPLLEFDAIMDDRTTDVCMNANGTRMAVDDFPYHLPLHWNERSVIRQVASGKITEPLNPLFPDDLKPMFKNNVAVSGVAFPDTHPFYETSKAINKELYAVADRQFTYALPRAQQFESIYKDNKTGGEIFRHLLADTKADDYLLNLNAAKQLAKEGKTMELLPVVREPEQDVRAIIYPDYDHKRKCPDLRDVSTGEYLDTKTPGRYRKVTHHANSAAEQKSIAIISDSNLYLDETIINEKAKAIFNQHDKNEYPYDDVYFFAKGKIYKRNRKDDK